MTNKVDVLSQVCDLLTAGHAQAAAQHLAEAYPPAPPQTKRSTWTPLRAMPVFLRDRFTDRYFGQLLVFPGTLRALSLLLPHQFPYQPNWKQSQTHPAYWELSPSIDHVVALARGGSDEESNVVTTSMALNAAKANWRLEELKWPSHRAPVSETWDGLVTWFHAAYERFELLRSDPGVRLWHQAAQKAGHRRTAPADAGVGRGARMRSRMLSDATASARQSEA